MLKKLDKLLSERRENIEYLSRELGKIPCLEPAKIRPHSLHSFYVHPIKYKIEATGIPRNIFVEAVKAELAPSELREAEGVKVGVGYVKPLYLLPLFQEKMVYNTGCPWSCEKYHGRVSYQKGLCPVAEKMHFEVLITHELMRPGMTEADLDDVAAAFQKVWDNKGELLRN